jgi:hypothetical protein
MKILAYSHINFLRALIFELFREVDVARININHLSDSLIGVSKFIY